MFFMKITIKSDFFYLFSILILLPLNSNLLSGEFDRKCNSVRFNKLPLRLVLQQLSAKHQFNFIFEDELVDKVCINYHSENENPDALIRNIFHQVNLRYEFLTENTIIIYKNKKPHKTIRIVNGNVRDAETGSPLKFANAYIQGKSIGTATDLNGHFQFPIPDSTLQLIVSYMGYETEIHTIPPQSNKLDIRLRPKIFQFNSIEISAFPINDEIEQLSQAQLNEEHFVGVVSDISNEMTYASFMQYNSNEFYFSEGDDGKFFIKLTGNRLVPKIGADRNNRLAFRQHHVRLNGFGLQMPFHATIIPSMNTGIVNYDLIQKSESEKNVFDVSFGDEYDSILDVHYRQGSRNAVSGKIIMDLSNTSIFVEGPLSRKASWIIIGKKSHINKLLDSMGKGKWISLSYADVQAQLDYRITGTNNFRFNYIHSNDAIYFNPQMNYARERMLYSRSYSIDANAQTLSVDNVQEINIDESGFGLDVFSINAASRFSKTWQCDLTLNYSGQKYNNQTAWSIEHIITLPDISDSTYEYFEQTGNAEKFNIQRIDAQAVLYYGKSLAYKMKAGVQFEQFYFNTSWRKELYINIMNHISRPEHHNISKDNLLLLEKYACFYQEDRIFAQNFRLQTGVRLDYSNLSHEMHVNPRIILSYNKPADYHIRASFGTFSRIPQPGEIKQCQLIQLQPGYKEIDNLIGYQYIDKFSVNLEKDFSNNCKLNFELFYKNMKNLTPIQRLSDGSLRYDVANRASAYSQGFAVNLRWNYRMLSLTGRYKYTQAFEKTEKSDNYRYYCDQRHALTFSLNAILPRNWQLNIQTLYGSGYAFTPCVLPEFDSDLGYDRDSIPMWEFQTERPNSCWYPEYSRLDVSFQKRIDLSLGTLTLSANLINILNTSHTYSYIYTYEREGNPIRESESLLPFFLQAGASYAF